MKFSALVVIAFSLAVSARPQLYPRAASKADVLSNGQDAIALNQKFKTLSATSKCTSGENACVNSQFAQCVNGKFVLTKCNGGLICAALPLVNSRGTSVTCTTQADVNARIAATGAKGASSSSGSSASSSGSKTSSSSAAPAATNNAANNKGGKGNTGNNNNSGDLQKSLTLDNSVIAKGFANNGQDQPTAGQVPSLTSTNNFINFCATVPNLPITNGQQIKTGSCNPAPMGVIAAATNIPSAKFTFPDNLGTLQENTPFTIKLAVKHLETGHFTNANENYYSAPQVVNSAGDIQGHSHVVIEQISSLNSKTPGDPTKFAFFKGLNAGGSVLSADVTAGLPAGVYRAASINTAANHQPCLVAVAQHGSMDDMIYFTVKKAAGNTGKNGKNNGGKNN
ncbi:hypothetical protein C8Q75DRAFT_556435 [Abortiporus biennis]|nr:hypothetical protein C8Q75DRAFT_556435 [Abortiporus biennis]